MADARLHACGPDWLHHSIRELLSEKFNNPCEQHDDLYERYAKTLTRKHIDTLFLCNMLDASDQEFKYEALAYAMYGFVRAFGWLSYNRYR